MSALRQKRTLLVDYFVGAVEHARLSAAVPANNRRDVSWDKRRLFFGWLRHSAFPTFAGGSAIGSQPPRARCSLCFFAADIIILLHISPASTTEEAAHRRIKAK